MQTSVAVDIHPKEDNRVLLGPAPVVLAIFDGAASWENGAEGAAWVKEQVSRVLVDDAARHERAGQLDTYKLRKELAEIEAALRREPAFVELDVAFDFLMVVYREGCVELLARGSYGCRLVRYGQSFPALEARMLVDEVVAEGKLAASEVETFPHPEVCLGPYFGESRADVEGPALLVVEVALGPGDRLLVAPERVLRTAAARGSLSSVRAASELRSLAGSSGGIAAVIELKEGAVAGQP